MGDELTQNQLDPPIQLMRVDGLCLAYRESGTPRQPALILLHGLAETSAFFWRPLIAHFQADYHIFAFDLLGHGDSDKPGFGYESSYQATLIAEAMRQLGLESAVLVGHSLGGLVAAHLALVSPALVKKLVLYDTPLPDDLRINVARLIRYTPIRVSLAMIPLILPMVARTFLYSMPSRLILKLVLLSWRVPYHQEILNNEFLDEATRHSGPALVKTAQVNFRTNFIRHLGRLEVPTCIIVGDSDLMVPIHEAEEWAKRLPQGYLEVISKAGHVSLLDNPISFNHALERFFKD